MHDVRVPVIRNARPAAGHEQLTRVAFRMFVPALLNCIRAVKRQLQHMIACAVKHATVRKSCTQARKTRLTRMLSFPSNS